MYKGYPQARSDTPFLMGESSKTARTGFTFIIPSPLLGNNIPLFEHHVGLLRQWRIALWSGNTLPFGEQGNNI